MVNPPECPSGFDGLYLPPASSNATDVIPDPDHSGGTIIITASQERAKLHFDPSATPGCAILQGRRNMGKLNMPGQILSCGRCARSIAMLRIPPPPTITP